MSAARVLPPSTLRLVSVPITETDMPTKKSSLVKTSAPGVYRRGQRYTKPADADGQLLISSARSAHLLTVTTSCTRCSRRPLAAPACPWSPLHTFRHTCASLLFAPVEHGGGGKNAKQVQEWLGNRSPAYTLKEYVHLIDAGVGDAGLLDDLFR